MLKSQKILLHQLLHLHHHHHHHHRRLPPQPRRPHRKKKIAKLSTVRTCHLSRIFPPRTSESVQVLSLSLFVLGYLRKSSSFEQGVPLISLHERGEKTQEVPSLFSSPERTPPKRDVLREVPKKEKIRMKTKTLTIRSCVYISKSK
jgi:hypothetical protein